jgi:triacylglycerol lipase
MVLNTNELGGNRVMDSFAFASERTEYQPQNAYWLGRAAKLAYSDQDTVQAETGNWGFTGFRFLDIGNTQAFVAGREDMILIAFRGTEPDKLQDWMSDAKVRMIDALGGKVHRGFNKALDDVWDPLCESISSFRDRNQPLWFTGHSLGAALAVLATARAYADDLHVQGLYTFGQPRVGNRDFADNFDTALKPRSYRFVNNNDVVTRVPLRKMGYRHVGTYAYFDADGAIDNKLSRWKKFLDRVEGRIEDLGKLGTDGVKDHSMKRYVACLETNIDVNPWQ